MRILFTWSAYPLLAVCLVAEMDAGAGSHAVFKSTDRGRSWVRADAGMRAGSRVNAFGSLGGTLFAGTDSGIYVSRDEAGSWRPTEGLEISAARVVGFATLGGTLFAGAPVGGILISEDGGGTWKPSVSFPGSTPSVRCLLAHQGRLYVGTDAAGVIVSGDGGKRWTYATNGLPDGAQVFAMTTIEDRVFAGLYSKGLYVWSEKDRRWSKVGPVSPLVLASVKGTLVAGHNPGGLFWSPDQGATWSKGIASAVGQFTSEWPDPVDDLTSDAAVWELAGNDGLVIAGAGTGIYRSEDLGRTWARARAGLPAESPGISFLMRRNFILAGTSISNPRVETEGIPRGNRSPRGAASGGPDQ